MIGSLTDCINNEEVLKTYDFETTTSDDKPMIFHLIGGPTGYESFYMHDFIVKQMRVRGWVACAGTMHAWNRLVFSAEEMSKAFDEIVGKNELKTLVCSNCGRV